MTVIIALTNSKSPIDISFPVESKKWSSLNDISISLVPVEFPLNVKIPIVPDPSARELDNYQE